MTQDTAPLVAPEDRPEHLPPDGSPWYRRMPPWALVAGSALALVVGVVGVSFAAIYATADIPPPEELELPEPSIVYDAAGDEVATLDPGAIEDNVALADLPPHVPQAVLAAEDRDFRDHGGFSTTGILRAAWANVTSGEVVQGASTINQQYVSLAIAEIDDSIPGKFREVAVAARLDDELSKDRILEMYLNTVPFGRGVRGIEGAARMYFDKSATELDVNEAATLAGIIAAPSAYDPEDNPDAATARRDYALRGMVEIGALEPAEAEALIATPLPPTRDDPLVSHGRDAYFLDAVRDAIPDLLDEPDVDPFLDLRIHTTLDRRLQARAVETIRETLADTPHSGAIVTVDPGTGAVRALVGGLDYDHQQFNVAIDGSRQAGSAFKPFALTAFVDEGGSPESLVHGPRTLEVPDTVGETAEIHNYTQRGYGRLTVREATVRSVNTAYVNLATELGYERVAEMANELGVRSELPEVPTTVLGTGGVTPLDMVAAYATLAAGGVRHDVHVVTRIETPDGEVLFEHDGGSERVIDANTAAVVTDVLADVVAYGTGTAAAIDRPAAGKTGTTNDYRDAWFVGYTPHLATAVWVGNLDNSPMDRVTGGSLPATAWSAYMSQALEPLEPEPFPEPDLSALTVEEVDGITEADDGVTEEERTEAPAPTPEDTTAEPTESEPTTPEPTQTEPTPAPTETGPSQPEPTASPSGGGEPTESGPTATESPGSGEPSPSGGSEQPSPSEQPSGGGDGAVADVSGDGDGSGDGSASDGGTSSPSPQESPSP